MSDTGLLVSVVSASRGVLFADDGGDTDAEMLLTVLADCTVADLVGLIAEMGGLLVRLLSDVAAADGVDLETFIQQWALRMTQ